MKFIKNKFLFILLISIITLVLLVVGAITLYQNENATFNDDGYIISTTSESSSKYYFSANTEYKENVDDQITFTSTEATKVVVDPASFVHYSDGSIGYLQKGALVNLADITSPMISYYNVDTNNLITYNNDGTYTITSDDTNINLNAFVGRISDSKYIIAGANLSLKIPDSDEKITGSYFEVYFIEDGVAQIDNEDVSYKVTAQGSYVYVGDHITISLGDEKIYYDDTVEMLMSQITINNDENINLDVDESKTSGTGSDGDSSGDGTGSDSDTVTDGDADGTTDTDTSDDTTGDNSTTSDGTDGDESTSGDSGTGDGSSSSDGTSSSVTTAQIELIDATVTSTSLDLSFQLNNASQISGTLSYTITNLSTSEEETGVIDKVNGTFTISKDTLTPDTEYTVVITETSGTSEKQYFQKTFQTGELGISLEKNYATSDSLSYNINFDTNTEVTKVQLTIYDNNGTNTDISPSSYQVSSTDLSSEVIFSNLNSNSSYSVIIDKIWIGSISYSNVYNISRIDTTLKETPTISDISVTANSEEIKFTIKANEIDDPDNSIVSYIYYIYKADDITSDNDNPTSVYSVTKSDSDELVLNLNEIDELKTGVDYRCKIVLQYDDNEMTREVSSDYSNSFLIKSKPSINWELSSATMNKITGTITLVDANCTVPIAGRSCLNKKNTFTLRYYKAGQDETTENDKTFTFNSNTLQYNLTLSDLSSDTTYVVKIYGSYYDDDGVLHENVQIGDAFYVTTDVSENLKWKIIGDNTSGQNKDGTTNSANIVTFDAMLTAPTDSTIMEEVSKIVLNLYSGSYNTSDKLIGTYTITDSSTIEDFFSNFTITNSLFTNSTVGALDSLSKLIQVTNNSTKSLNGAYTVEIESVYDSTGRNKITVEDNVYTFKLTSSYYLDSRIETNSSYKYITVDTITKEELSEDEYDTLSESVSNLDDLNDDTVVGITIENSLSDTFVDSAFDYEKVVVTYIIYNATTNTEIKRISVDMGNKYQPKTQTVYLDSSELDDGKNYFTRGYQYKISYELSFTTEDGDNPTYTNSKLSKTIEIDRQSPIYTQYISTSDEDGITYKYSMTDTDNALYNNSFCYTSGEDNDKQCLSNTITADGEYHTVTIPLTTAGDYTIYYNRKNTSNESTSVSITSSTFESLFSYTSNGDYTIVNDNDNKLKIEINSNDINDRTIAYKVELTSSGISTYTKYFLKDQLITEENVTGTDEDGNDIVEYTYYIAIDYASISRFMGKSMTVKVTSYYDSGLIGLNQDFSDGFILKNSSNKYLTIYNAGSDTTSTVSETSTSYGIYKLKETYVEDSTSMSLYNYLYNTKNYDKYAGVNDYSDSTSLASNIGIGFDLRFTNNGIVFINGSKEYSSYNPKVLKTATLSESNNTTSYKFDSITPKISVNTKGTTINSITVNITPSGIYSEDQFDNATVYIDFYSDSDLSNKLTELTSTITKDDDSDSYTINSVTYENLDPNTTYYFTVSVDIDGTRTRLYDSSSSNEYITKTYTGTTLGNGDSNKLLSSLVYKMDVTGYMDDTSTKTLTWQLGFTSTENFKIRMELYDEDDNLVNFDGSATASCDNTVNGSSENGYVSNCYIQVSKEDIENISTNNVYTFTGDDFVFGGEYYKLYVYAIPYYDSGYDEERKVLIYENDSLTTTNSYFNNSTHKYQSSAVTENGITTNILIPTLESPTFSINDLTSGYCKNNIDIVNNTTDTNGICEEINKDGYYISLVTSAIDKYYTIKYGNYTVSLLDSDGENVIDYKTVSASSANYSVVFTGLDTNELYYVEVSYETYRNNSGYTEAEKVATNSYTDFIYTPVYSEQVELGTVTASMTNSQMIKLSYQGTANLDKITKIIYTVTQMSSNSSVSGEIDASSDSLFTVDASKLKTLSIDLSSSSNSSFTLSSGNTYTIKTQYYYTIDNVEKIITKTTQLNV